MPDMKEKFAQLDQAIQELKDQPGRKESPKAWASPSARYTA